MTSGDHVPATADARSTRALTLIEQHMKWCDEREEVRRQEAREEREATRLANDRLHKSLDKLTDGMTDMGRVFSESLGRVHERIDKSERGRTGLYLSIAGTVILILLSAVGFLGMRYFDIVTTAAQ